MSNLDNRISNADQLLTNDIDKFCESVTDFYSNASKPVLDIIIYMYRLTANIGAKVLHDISRDTYFTHHINIFVLCRHHQFFYFIYLCPEFYSHIWGNQQVINWSKIFIHICSCNNEELNYKQLLGLNILPTQNQLFHIKYYENSIICWKVIRIYNKNFVEFTGRLTVQEQKLEGDFRYVNSRLITNSEEVSRYFSTFFIFLFILDFFKRKFSFLN